MEESARAFSAAEAGIEEALRTKDQRINTTFAAGVGYASTVKIIGDTTGIYTLPTTLVGQAETIWLAAHNASNGFDDPPSYYYPPASSIDICWSHATPVPALEIAIYYKVGSSYFVSRGAYDPDAISRSSNKFSSVTDSDNSAGGCGGLANAYRQLVSMPSGVGVIPLMMRIRPYYNSATITISPLGGNRLPQQGIEISSTGCTQITDAGCTEGGVTRKIVVRQQYPGPSSIFDYSLYSQGSITH